MDDDGIRDVVKRLSRSGSSGQATVERAAILAEGSDSIAVVAWILAHGGHAEEAAAATSAGGLHSSRLSGRAETRSPQPVRYVLPSDSLS